MTARETVLIVDDQAENISILIETLHGSFTLLAATDGETALERTLGSPRPDLVLLDVMMPGMSGYEVCRRLKLDPATRDIPVIFITSLDNPDNETKGLRLGAVDYITKPFSPPVVEARVRTQLQLIQARKLLMEQNEVLEERVRKRTAEVIQAQKERVQGLNNFANAVAHQIRNPVMSLGGMAGLLVKRISPDSRLAEYAVAMREESMRLENLVNIISEYVALTVDEVVPVDVVEMVEKSVDQVRALAEERGIGLSCRVDVMPGEIMVEPGLAVQALVEILENCLDFCTGKAVEVTIRGGTDICDEELSVAERFYDTDCRYGVRITDNGSGISPEALPYVTDPFYTTKAVGVGLGLTKAKRILCEEMGGTLRVTSPHAETGTVVTMTFILGV